MENFIEKLKAIQTLEESIGPMELKRLSANLSEEYDCEETLESNLLLFFSLNAKDVEVLLKFMRKTSRIDNEDGERSVKFLEENEKPIAKMVSQLNELSLAKVNKPFHLAAALGELEVDEKTAAAFERKIKGLPIAEDKALKAGSCPFGVYPRYVSKQWPWKLKMSFKTRTRQRKEDVGCHFQHGPFKGVIKGWVSFHYKVIVMVLLQGWGFKLAANNNHFFYKWWFVLAVGLTPWSCHWLLFARKF